VIVIEEEERQEEKIRGPSFKLGGEYGKMTRERIFILVIREKKMTDSIKKLSKRGLRGNGERGHMQCLLLGESKW